MSRLGRWVPLVAVVALLGAAMLAAVYGNPTIEFVPLDPPTFSQETDEAATGAPSTAPAESAAPQPPPSLPNWVGWAVSALCLAVILAIAGAMAWVMLRDRLFGSKAAAQSRLDAAASTSQVREGVRAAVDEGLAELDDSDGDPRRAIIACWVRLERAGAAAGTARHPGDSSTDFVFRLLGAHQVSADVLEPFAAVYRRARFATGDVDTSMRDRARSALVQLRDELVATAGVS